MRDTRKNQLAAWVGEQLNIETPELDPISSDASFRRYFRFIQQKKALIAVDAPPATENNQAFTQVAALLNEYGLSVPLVQEVDFDLGFMILTDLGNKLYLPSLTQESVDKLYLKAINAIQTMQSIPLSKLSELPQYDHELLNTEMDLFNEWLIRRHLQLELTQREHSVIKETFANLTQNALNQPQFFVHRDYHSRNLMICAGATPGLLDFQDAVLGPISYDLVSLLKDCYIQWPPRQIKRWSYKYYQKIHEIGLISYDFERFFKQFELMGMQRHLKVLGIFCRLNYRDKKPAYLRDLPMTFDYLIKAVARYPEFAEFYEFLQTRIQPLLNKN